MAGPHGPKPARVRTRLHTRSPETRRLDVRACLRTCACACACARTFIVSRTMLPFSSSTTMTSSGLAMRQIISWRSLDRMGRYSALRPVGADWRGGQERTQEHAGGVAGRGGVAHVFVCPLGGGGARGCVGGVQLRAPTTFLTPPTGRSVCVDVRACVCWGGRGGEGRTQHPCARIVSREPGRRGGQPAWGCA